MHAIGVLDTLKRVAVAVHHELAALADWGEAGTRSGQYRSDLAADAVAVQALVDAGFGVLSEESGLHHSDRAVIVVVDPVDGSTNASLGLPWYATSLCAVDDAGPLASVVRNQATGVCFQAERGRGAHVGDRAVTPTDVERLGAAVVGVNGVAPRHLGWAQYRALGAAALDLCAVADGALHAYVDLVDPPSHAPWDYLGGLLVCREAGVPVIDRDGAELVVLDHEARRRPVAAATPALLDALLAAVAD